MELRTTNEIRCVTDNAGWIAWNEPGLMETEVCWTISGPGIEREKDGFGYRVFRTTAKAGVTTQVKVKNTNIASRLGRLTGQGLYRHSALLGLPTKVPNIQPGNVIGQDSVQAVPFNGKIFWLWGDTNQARYPLGNFHTTTALTTQDQHPEEGLKYEYFLNPTDPKQLRKSFPTDKSGVVWMFGLMSLRDSSGQDQLYSGYTRRPGLEPAEELGIANWDQVAEHFKKVGELPKDNEWPMPSGHAVRAKTEDGDHFYFCRPFAHVRVAAEAESIVDWKKYEMLVFDEAAQKWLWKPAPAPTTQKDEAALLKQNKMPPPLARHRISEKGTGKQLEVHTASIQWNEYRKKFILIALQWGHKDAPSHLGEVWFAESDAITGPWSPAVKIATHPNYSFYNPIHHHFFNREGGRIIYFEGTYTATFSGNPTPTPQYEYNQLMYRLDLADPRLNAGPQRSGQ